MLKSARVCRNERVAPGWKRGPLVSTNDDARDEFDEAADVSPEELERLAEDPVSAEDVDPRPSRKPTLVRRALANDDLIVWVVGVVLAGVVVVWIFR